MVPENAALTLTGVLLFKDGFGIRYNPYTGNDVPQWIQSRRFESEYLAGLALHIYLAKLKHGEFNQHEFDKEIKFTFRLLQLESKWAE